MSDALSLAFKDLDDRAGPENSEMHPPDRISLRDHIVTVEIGAFQPERGTRQRLAFNVVVEVRVPEDADDDVDRILSYDRITEAIEAELAGDRLNLLETLAERLALRVLSEPQALRVFVRIEKLDLGPGALGVEIVRDRTDLAKAEAAIPGDDAVTPIILFLGNSALTSDNLVKWLDAIEARGEPAILCVGMPDASVIRTGHSATQWRVDLLAIEQNAWQLAARDPRCTVVDSRTELEWAVGKGRISVWAPSKMVLDSGHPPSSHAPAQMVPWLAEAFESQNIVAVGERSIPGARYVDPQDPALF